MKPLTGHYFKTGVISLPVLLTVVLRASITGSAPVNVVRLN
ncbi:MAG: hypothetical protein ACOY7J_03265 [Pseudomonadota bacterium]